MPFLIFQFQVVEYDRATLWAARSVVKGRDDRANYVAEQPP